MKRSLEWHKTCLAHQRSHLSKSEDELRHVKDRVNQLRFDVFIYDSQIQRAEEEKRDGFDADKFNKSRDRKLAAAQQKENDEQRDSQ